MASSLVGVQYYGGNDFVRPKSDFTYNVFSCDLLSETWVYQQDFSILYTYVTYIVSMYMVGSHGLCTVSKLLKQSGMLFGSLIPNFLGYRS